MSASTGKYITIEEGEDFRSIATKMKSLGSKMNHATARNVTLLGMQKFLGNLARELNCPVDDETCKSLTQQQHIHELIGEILPLICDDMKEAKEKQ